MKGSRAHTENPHTTRTDWQNLRRLFPYLWEYRWRIILALLCLLVAKLATVGVPILLKYILPAGVAAGLWRPAPGDRPV